MDDRRELQEMTGAVSLGVLAEEMVLAVGKLKRDEVLASRDVETIRGGQQLLEGLSADEPRGLAPAGARHMGGETAMLDVFRAVRLQAPEEPVREFLRKLAAPLAVASRQERLGDEDRQLLPDIQALFSRVGELTLARSNDFYERPRKEPSGWIGNARGFAF